MVTLQIGWVPLSPSTALQQMTSVTVNVPTWISADGKSSLLDLVMSNFPADVSCSSSAQTGLSDHMLVRVDISGYSESCLSAGESGSSLRQVCRDCRQPSHFRTGIPYLLPPISTRPGNSSTESCSLFSPALLSSALLLSWRRPALKRDHD